MDLPEKPIEFSGAIFENFLSELTEAQLLQAFEILQRKQVESTVGKIERNVDLSLPEFAEFDDREVEKITPKVLDIRKRRYVAFVHYYANFDRTDEQMISFIRLCNPDMSYVQCVRDLNKIKGIIGNMPKVRKELMRYQVIEMQKRAYQLAQQLNDPKGMVAATNGISSAAQLDKEDNDTLLDQMIAPSWEPTNDLAALGEGFERRKNIEYDIEKLKKKYGDYDEAELVP